MEVAATVGEVGAAVRRTKKTERAKDLLLRLGHDVPQRRGDIQKAIEALGYRWHAAEEAWLLKPNTQNLGYLVTIRKRLSIDAFGFDELLADGDGESFDATAIEVMRENIDVVVDGNEEWCIEVVPA